MTQNMSEIEQLVQERFSELEELQKELNIEDIEEIKKLVIHHFNTLPNSRFYTTDKKWTRALSFTAADLGTFEGVKMELNITAYGRPKDWNAVEIEKIQADWDKGPLAQEKLIDEWKVMRMNTPDGLKAVSRIDKIEKTDNGTRVTDSVDFQPRLAVLGAILEPIYRRVFAHRHKRLQRKYGVCLS